MKISKEKLKRIIKEELDKVMKEGGLEEIKGPAGAAISKFSGNWARTLGHQATTGTGDDVGEVIKQIRRANDERDQEEDDIYGPTITKDEVITDLLTNINVDPQSELGLEIRKALKAAAEVNAARKAEHDKKYMEEAKMTDDEEKKAAANLAHDKAKKGMMKQDLADKEKAAKGQSTNPVASKERPIGGKPQLSGKGNAYNNPVKSAAATAKARGLAEETELAESEELEEVKGKEAKKDPEPSDDPTYAKEVEAAFKKDLEDQDRKNALRSMKKQTKRVEESVDQQMEQLSESFRRFTKLPKAVLKD